MRRRLWRRTATFIAQVRKHNRTSNSPDFWLADVSSLLSPEEDDDLFPYAMDAFSFFPDDLECGPEEKEDEVSSEEAEFWNMNIDLSGYRKENRMKKRKYNSLLKSTSSLPWLAPPSPIQETEQEHRILASNSILTEKQTSHDASSLESSLPNSPPPTPSTPCCTKPRLENTTPSLNHSISTKRLHTGRLVSLYRNDIRSRYPQPILFQSLGERNRRQESRQSARIARQNERRSPSRKRGSGSRERRPEKQRRRKDKEEIESRKECKTHRALRDERTKQLLNSVSRKLLAYQECPVQQPPR